MSRDTSSFQPVATCDIVRPILEESHGITGEGLALPRVLRQAAGSGRSARNVTCLAVLFLLIALFELALLVRLPVPSPIIVYGDFPRKTLLEDLR